jgi:hypothetical protein
MGSVARDHTATEVQAGEPWASGGVMWGMFEC